MGSSALYRLCLTSQSRVLANHGPAFEHQCSVHLVSDWLVRPITGLHLGSSALYTLCLTGYFVTQSSKSAPSHRHRHFFFVMRSLQVFDRIATLAHVTREGHSRAARRGGTTRTHGRCEEPDAGRCQGAGTSASTSTPTPCVPTLASCKAGGAPKRLPNPTPQTPKP